MSTSDLVPSLAFSLQYPNLTPSHADYVKVGARSQVLPRYYYVKFSLSQLWKRMESGGLSDAQRNAYNQDVNQLGDLLHRLVTKVSLNLS
jgi:hypothetical protein